MKNLAILTSGGDSPSMNAAIRAITRKAIAEGYNVYGIARGYEGLLNNEFISLQRRDVGSIVNKGGTMLKTARCLEFKEESNQKKAYEILKKNNIDILGVIGGDGSMRGAMALSALGMPTFTIPATIDNDMNGTDYTLGFDTSVNTVLDAVNKIRDTTMAHERVAIVEVMGRSAGHIAVQAGLACGAEAVLIPEYPLSLEKVCERLNQTHQNGKHYSILLVAEGAYSSYEVANYIRANTYLSPSVTVLGYLQRGGSPSAHDAIMAALYGNQAIEEIKKGNKNFLVGSHKENVVIVPYEEAVHQHYPVKDEEYNLINILSQ